ncbi:MAG: oligosaccharide flippase family protein [Bacteroidota bacterium]|nr:oligosaccharide flippase family protein [Bacteroidota bacterium]
MVSRFSLKSGFVRNVLTLFTGSSIAQAIPVLVSPLLTRLYPVEDFAALTVITTLISLVGVIVAGRYEVAVGLPENNREAKQLVYLAVIISFMVSGTTLISLLFFHAVIADLLNMTASPGYLFLVPFAALFYGLIQAFTYWHIRQRKYNTLAASRINQSLVNSGLSLGFAFTGWGINGLIIGNVSGHLSAMLHLLRSSVKDKILDFKKSDRIPADLKVLAGKYSDLPKVNGVHAFTDMAQSSFVIFLISGYFGAIATGLYGLTIRILQAPLNVIGSSVAIVFYKEVAEKINRKEKITKLLRTTITTLALISLPLFIVIFIWGPELFGWVFGKDWREAGNFARILCPWLYLNFIASPLSHLPVILNKQRQYFLFSLIGNIAVIISLSLGAYLYGDISSSLILIAITQALFQLSMICYFIHIARNAEKTSMH